MKHEKLRRIIGILILVISIVMIGMGMTRKHKVYDEQESVFFYKISERMLVIDATFSGVRRIGDKLITTYDRSRGVGKRACPT